MYRKIAVVLACSVTLLSCSVDQPSEVKNAVTETQGSNLEQPQRDIAEGSAATEGEFDFLGGRISFPFNYQLRYDRSVPTENFIEQRQIFLEVTEPGLDVEEIGDRVQQVMAEAAFVPESASVTDGVLRARFQADEFPSIFVLVRPKGVGPALENQNAVGSIYITQGLNSR